MIQPDQHFRKTAKGIEEIDTRKHKLPTRLRSLLILIFSSKSAAELQEQAAAIGAQADFLQTLIDGGFIEPVGGVTAEVSAPPPSAEQEMTPADRFIAGQRLMEQTVTEAGGLRSYMFQLKLSKCGTCTELKNLLPEYEKFMVKLLGQGPTQVYLKELNGILR
ncbi:MAG: hypothetical protein ACRDRT_02040 [Pseudonocardiaceae bacterium]